MMRGDRGSSQDDTYRRLVRDREAAAPRAPMTGDMWARAGSALDWLQGLFGVVITRWGRAHR